MSPGRAWIAVAIVALVALGELACSAKAGGPRVDQKPPRSELGVFMKMKLNPPFSKLSFLLFHDADGSTPDAAIKPEELPAAAEALVAAAKSLKQWPSPPGDDEQGRLVFYEYAGTLETDALQLLEAVKANQRAEAQQQFTELRKKCDSCHHFFRYEGTLSLYGEPAPAATN